MVALALALLVQGGLSGWRPGTLAQDGEVDRILLRFNQRRDKAATLQEFRRVLADTRSELERFLRENPRHRDAGRAAFHAAESYLSAQELDTGVEKLRAFVKEFPGSEHVATARFAVGEALLQKEDDAGARAAFEEFLAHHAKDERALYARAYVATTHQNEKRYDRAEAALLEVRKEFKDRKESWGAAMQLAVVYHLQGKNAESRRLLEDVIRDCPDREATDVARRHLSQFLKLDQPAPAFSEKDVAGGDFILERHRGKVVVLYFFDPTLAPAGSEAGFLRRARDAFKPDEVQILGVSVSPDRKDLALYKTELRVDWPLHFDAQGLDGRIARLYDVRGLPHLVVIDRKGLVRYFNIAGRDLRHAVAKLLEEK
jgi:TolA-binding protein